MNIIIIVIVAMALFYGAIFYFMRMKKEKAAELMKNTDFTQEMAKADQYKNNFLNRDFDFIKKQMAGKPIDAFNFANTKYSTKDSVKDGMKDGLKGLATLGTVRFTTVQTPKYLVLSDSDLHLLDTDTDGDFSDHFIFDRSRLEKSTLKDITLEGTMKSFATQKGENVKAYQISLATDTAPIELVIFSTLLFTYSGAGSAKDMLSMDSSKTIQEIVIANDFLKKLGDKYPHLKVQTIA